MPSRSFPLRLFTLFVLTSNVLFTRTAYAGKLGGISQRVRGGSPSSSFSGRSTFGRASGFSGGSYHRRSYGGWGRGTYGASGESSGAWFYYVIAFPWLLPNLAVEGNRPPGADRLARFADYPYADGAPGFLLDPVAAPVVDVPREGVGVETQTEATGTDPTAAGQSAAAQLASETGSDMRVLRAGFRTRVQFPMRFELASDWSLYSEVDRGMRDALWMGRELLSVRFAESSTIQFRSGIGPQHLVDSSGWVHGADVMWGFDAFPGRPIVLSFEASVGSLGEALTAGLYARLGVIQGPVEVSAGWHQRWIGGIPLGAPFVSLSYWL